MKVKKTTPKMSGLVVAALRNLRDAHGSTAKEIMKYIMAEYNASEATVQRQLKTALKRGVEYGILKKTTAGYSLNTDAEVIGPLDLEQMDGCGRKKRKRMSCKPKRKSCKPKRKACPKKRRRKRNPCGTCSARGRRGDCSSQAINLVHERTPTLEETNQRGGGGSGGGNNEADKRSIDEEDQDQQQPQRRSRSRSNSKAGGRRSRSQSLAQSRFSGSGDDDEQDND